MCSIPWAHHSSPSATAAPQHHWPLLSQKPLGNWKIPSPKNRFLTETDLILPLINVLHTEKRTLRGKMLLGLVLGSLGALGLVLGHFFRQGDDEETLPPEAEPQPLADLV